MSDKHQGCFFCGGGHGEVLTSGQPRPTSLTAASKNAPGPGVGVSVCSACISKVEVKR